MNKKYIFIGIAAVIVIFLFLVLAPKKPRIDQPPSTISGYEIVEGPYEKIRIIGDSPRNGIYDPSVEYGPDGTGWLAYSAVYGGRIPFGPHVETHLAKSNDNGKTWQYVQTIHKSYDDSITLPNGETVEGNWNYEVSSLVYDSLDRGKEWKLFSHHIFANPKDNKLSMPQYSWISYRYASDPAGEWSDEIGLFHGRALPAKYAEDVKINLNDLHRDLSKDAVYSEPGTVVVNGVIYLSLTALTNKPRAIILLASEDHAKTWRYVGTLADRNDAEKIGYDAFDGTSLVEAGGKHYLLAAPKKEGIGEYIGTYVIEIEDIESAKLKRDGDTIIPSAYIKPDQSIYYGNAGESDYDEKNTAGGVVMAQLNVKDAPEIFQIFNTKYNIPLSKKAPVSEDVPKKEFGEWENPQKIDILGYDDHAMEPFISRDGQYLSFNNRNEPPKNTDLHYATRIDDVTFQYQGKIQGASVDGILEAVASMDEQQTFYFTTPVDAAQTQ